MKRKSSAMLTTQATATKYIGRVESPNPRKIEAMILYAMMKGMPAKHTVRYWAVPSTASGGVSIRLTMALRPQSSAPVVSTASRANSVTVLPMTEAARVVSCEPTALAVSTVVPMARPMMTTVTKCKTWAPIDTAVMVLTSQYRPITNRSVSPYSICRK